MIISDEILLYTIMTTFGFLIISLGVWCLGYSYPSKFFDKQRSRMFLFFYGVFITLIVIVVVYIMERMMQVNLTTLLLGASPAMCDTSLCGGWTIVYAVVIMIGAYFIIRNMYNIYCEFKQSRQEQK
jgi:hypothetical protein